MRAWCWWAVSLRGRGAPQAWLVAARDAGGSQRHRRRLRHHLFEVLNVAKLRRQIGFVLQESYLFDDTIARNIAFGEDEDGWITRYLVSSGPMHKLIGGAFRTEVKAYATGLYFTDMSRLVPEAVDRQVLAETQDPRGVDPALGTEAFDAAQQGCTRPAHLADFEHDRLEQRFPLPAIVLPDEDPEQLPVALELHYKAPIRRPTRAAVRPRPSWTATFGCRSPVSARPSPRSSATARGSGRAGPRGRIRAPHRRRRPRRPRPR